MKPLVLSTILLLGVSVPLGAQDEPFEFRAADVTAFYNGATGAGAFS